MVHDKGVGQERDKLEKGGFLCVSTDSMSD